MNLLDVNILVAAHRDDHPHHGLVDPWFARMLADDEPFWVPDTVWSGFIRISTSRRIFTVPTPIADAFAFLQVVRAQPNHVDLTPTPKHFDLFEKLCRDADAVGNLAADAYLAALALEHGCVMISLDRDFARFSELRWQRPEA
jgi:hypothetical protein